ncbi:MAG: type II secretion system protein [Bacteroidota bacterium]
MMPRHGFTKIELLIVIGMIAVLAAILFPVFAKSREVARRGACLNNLWQIGQALRLYALDGDGRYPPTEDDLSPLYPRYLGAAQVFDCPSNSASVPMGAPANPKRMAPPSGPPPEAGPGGKGGPAGPPPAPPGPQSLAPREPVIVLTQDAGGPAGGAVADDILKTSYYYRAGRRHNQTPRAPLCTDQSLPHNDRANMLYSDGTLISLPESRWRAEGFVPLAEFEQKETPRGGGAVKSGGGGEG